MKNPPHPGALVGDSSTNLPWRLLTAAKTVGILNGTTTLRALDVQYLTVSVYRDRNGRSAYEVEGRLVARTESLGLHAFQRSTTACASTRDAGFRLVRGRYAKPPASFGYRGTGGRPYLNMRAMFRSSAPLMVESLCDHHQPHSEARQLFDDEVNCLAAKVVLMTICPGGCAVGCADRGRKRCTMIAP